MKKYAKIVQADTRGQIVIPKDVRRELNIDEGTGFYMYTIDNEGILLKLIPAKELADNTHIVKEIEVHGDRIDVKKKNLDSSIQKYKKKSSGNMETV